MPPEDLPVENRGGLPSSPTGRVPTWVQDEAFRAQTTGTVPNYGPFTESLPGSSGPVYLGGTGDPAGRYLPPGSFPPEPPRRSLGARLAGIGVALALGLAAVFVAHDLLTTTRVPPELLVPYTERTDLPQPLSVAPARDVPTPSAEEQPWPLDVPPKVEKTSDSWAYMPEVTVRGRSQPVLWSPCRPIHYVVNTEGAPDDFLVRVTEVADEVSAATGLQLTYDGTTHEPLDSDREPYLPTLYGDRWAPVLIGWADEEQIPGLEGDVGGMAFPHWERDAWTDVMHTVSGQVALDLVLREPRWRDTWVGVLRHELAHIVGLDHIDDESQVMFERSGVHEFQDGDLTGLAAVGAGPCAPGL
ncbi:MAG: hypothetical protein GX593_11350 [Actinomycetales bacterium]|nr:hypothetical protein [Actinomycetales bacterium]